MPKKVTSKDYINKCKVQRYDLPIENYISAKVKIKHKCSKGHIYEQTPSSHLSGKGCPKCKNIKLSIAKKRTPEEYYQECKSKGIDLPIEKYKGNSIKIKHKCIRNHIYEQRPHDHLQGQGCPKCSGNYSYTPKEYYQECKSKGIDIPIEDYIDTKTKIKHKCNRCGNIYEQTPNKHLIRGHGCPKCNESHGEKYIRNYLDKHHIKYISQKRFHDLKDKTYLSYDFYLPKQNILIEYQGLQHYESISFNGKDYTDLDKQQLHDNLKRTYAKDNGYKLLELKYTLDSQELVDKYLINNLSD